MITCILAKFFASLIGVYFSFSFFKSSPLFASFLIGVLPIWSEVLASFLKKVEPAREKRQNVKILDNIVDGLVFILIPSGCYFFSQGPDPFSLIFVFAGIWRLLKFVKQGLVGNFFIGLPVTYTGYIWPILILLSYAKIPYHNILLLVLAWAMNSKHIKIKAPNYESTQV